jgi:hypothetical protein
MALLQPQHVLPPPRIASLLTTLHSRRLL